MDLLAAAQRAFSLLLTELCNIDNVYNVEDYRYTASKRSEENFVSSRYLDMMRSQRRRNPTFQFTSKSLLALLALIAMGGSAVYWWGVQSTLIPDNRVVALAFTAILVLA